ncbi:MAG: divalent-cation tolerance protein CutA [Hyphomicrobiaceae bacterium]|nr:divalent-cation tolerance protein CutA [Hyphomicrobiaceae bacterium]
MPEKSAGVNVAGSTGLAVVPSEDRAAIALVYATYPTAAEAERIGAELVGMELAACVNIVPGMRSIYRWQGAVHRDDEVLGIVKTRATLAARVIGVVRVLHPYVNPAVVVLPVVGGSADFLGWIAAETAAAC